MLASKCGVAGYSISSSAPRGYYARRTKAHPRRFAGAIDLGPAPSPCFTVRRVTMSTSRLIFPLARRRVPVSQQADSQEPTQNEIIGVVTPLLSNWGTGPLAELRRLDPAGSLSEPALHRLPTAVPESWLYGDGLRRWALTVHA